MGDREAVDACGSLGCRSTRSATGWRPRERNHLTGRVGDLLERMKGKAVRVQVTTVVAQGHAAWG